MGDHEVFAKQRGEDGWAALEKFLDLTNDEWRAAKRTMVGQQVQVLFVGGEPLDLHGVHPVAQVGEGGEGQDQVEEGQDQEGDGEGQEGDGLLELALAVAAQGSDEDEEGDGNQ